VQIRRIRLRNDHLALIEIHLCYIRVDVVPIAMEVGVNVIGFGLDWVGEISSR